jgi:hypothetical protein
MSQNRCTLQPFNANDVLVCNTLFCKYICKNDRDNFDRSNFLQEVVSDKIIHLSGYDKTEIRRTIHNRNNHFNDLIKHCL